MCIPSSTSAPGCCLIFELKHKPVLRLVPLQQRGSLGVVWEPRYELFCCCSVTTGFNLWVNFCADLTLFNNWKNEFCTLSLTVGGRTVRASDIYSVKDTWGLWGLPVQQLFFLYCTACVGDTLFTDALHISTGLYYSLISHYIWGSLFLEIIKGWLTTLPHLFFETLKCWHTKQLAALCSYECTKGVGISIVFSDVLPDLHPRHSADKPSLTYWAFSTEKCWWFYWL